jgi:hypothetical protein
MQFNSATAIARTKLVVIRAFRSLAPWRRDRVKMTNSQVILFKVICGVVGLSIVSWLGFAIVRFNLRRLRVIRAAAAATGEQLEEIYRLVEAGGSERANGFVLGRLNETADDASCRVAIPSELAEFPWAGMSVAVDVNTDVRFRFLNNTSNNSGEKTQLLGQRYRPVSVPRVQLKSGKIRNQFFPSRHLKGNKKLREKLASICADDPAGLLSYLLCAGRAGFVFEPIDQGRIGTSAAWVQDPEFQYCDQCNNRMALILQLPGTLLHKKLHRGTFYFFGCKRHADRTRTVAQFT